MEGYCELKAQMVYKLDYLKFTLKMLEMMINYARNKGNYKLNKSEITYTWSWLSTLNFIR